eukprot:SAG31_NODE_2053_length_6551_cov_7.496125_7_plen_158_part_00
MYEQIQADHDGSPSHVGNGFQQSERVSSATTDPKVPSSNGGSTTDSDGSVNSAALQDMKERIETIANQTEKETKVLQHKIDQISESMKGLEAATLETKDMLRDLIRHSVMSVRMATTPERPSRSRRSQRSGGTEFDSVETTRATNRSLDPPLKAARP